GAQILLRKTPVGKVAYVPRGPVIAPGHDDLLADFCVALHRAARDLGAFCLTIEPSWCDDPRTMARMRSLGFRRSRSTLPRSTRVLDLRPAVRHLGAALSPQTREKIALASRRGVEIGSEDAAGLSVLFDLLR